MNLRALLLTSCLGAGLLAVGGCGGGGGGGGGSSGTAALAGRVLLRNGSTSNLGGVHLTFPRTGATVTTASDGSFSFGSVPAGTITLRVSDPLAQAAVAHDTAGGGDTGGDGASGEDLNDDSTNDATDSDPNDDGDNNDTGDDDFDVAGVGDGESVEVAITVDNGIVTSLDVARSSEDDREAEVRLTRSVESDDPDVTGKLETESRTDRQRIKIDVEHLDAGRVVHAVVVAPDSSEADLGAATASAEGEARWDVDTSLGDTLPFGVATVADLAGYGVEIRAQGGTPVLLFGTLPDTPTGTEDHSGTESFGRVALTPASGVTGQAHVSIEHKTGDTVRDEIQGEVEGLAPGTVLEVWLGDPTNGGALTKVATVTVGSEGDAEVQVDTGDGDVLPFGLTTVEALVGMGVEVRNASGGAVLFSGTIPALVSHD